ncbi:hypothetical protein pb186bvf_018362 [Paramecium bursaria]
MSQVPCVDPKYFSKYSSNGTGRDQYVVHSNGGLDKNSYLYQDGYYERQTNFRRKLQATNSLPLIEAKFQHYPPDGTGRDFYITTNEGGLQQSPKKFNFIAQLRGYEACTPKPLPNDFLRTTSYTTKRQYLKSRLLRQSQQQLVHKLSSPKS